MRSLEICWIYFIGRLNGFEPIDLFLNIRLIRSSGVARLATHCYSQLIAAGKFSPRTNILNINIEREHIPHICSPFQHNEMELHKNLFFFHLICNQFSSLFYFGFFVYCFATKKNFVRSREFALCVHFWKHIQLNFQFIDVFLHLNKLLLSNQKGGLFLCVFEKFFLFMDFPIWCSTSGMRHKTEGTMSSSN